MNGLIKFWRGGAEDADRRVAALLAAAPASVADRYLMSSVVVRNVDRLTMLLRTSMINSEAGQAASAARRAWQGIGWPGRYRTVALVLLIAAGIHVAATLIRGEHPGWFWSIVPGLASVFAVLLLFVSRSRRAGVAGTID